MDVGKWLDETVGPGPPATLTLPPARDPREEPVQQNDRPSFHQTRRCSHLFSDSSLLHVLRSDTVQGFSAHNPDHVDRPTTAPSDASDPQQQEAADPYTRRPRPRTRLEIYEPKLRADREKTKQRRKREKEKSGKKGSKPKPKPKSRPNAAKDKPPRHAHAFHAQNVSSERLTMMPNRSLGLFKKGRASTPAKGRGLPDLVFSEMRFLQKQHDDTREKTREETRNKRKRNDPTHVQGQEISAYFGAKRPPLAEKDQNIQRKPSEHRSRSTGLCQTSSPGRSSTRFEMELRPDKPYLGFGSRGVDPLASDPTTYYCIPWSVSVRNASHQEYQPPEAPLPPIQPSLRPCKQSAKAHGSVGGHSGRDSGASGEGEWSQRAGQIAARSTTGRCRNSNVIPRGVGRRESGSSPKAIAERSVPSTSNQSTVPKHEPRLRKESRRFNGRFDKSVLKNANLDKETVDGAVKADKHREPNRTASNQVPDCRVERRKMRTENADSNEIGYPAKVLTPRSWSPLGKLLRNCENACNESYSDTGSLSSAIPVSSSPLAAARKVLLTYERDEVHRPTMPQRWASGEIPGRPSFYERQWSEGVVDEVPCEVFEGEDDVDAGKYANVMGNAYTDIDFGGSGGWAGDDLEVQGAWNGGYGDRFEDFPGPSADEAVANTRATVGGGEVEWTWRRHKLY